MIRPGIGRWRWKDFSREGDAYTKAGEHAALRALPAISRLLNGVTALAGRAAGAHLQPG